MDAQWSDDFHHALHPVLTGERGGYYADFAGLGDLAKALQQAFVYDGVWSGERRRPHGRSTVGLSGHRFLGYIQNHDQVGNRARGERIAHLAGVERAKIAAALVLTSPFVPMLFQGEEWGASTPFQYFTDFPDPALGQAVSEGRRREFAAFGWDPAEIPDPQDPHTFERSKLNWAERDREPHRDILDWYTGLIALRRNTPDLGNGRLDRVRVDWDEREAWLRVDRGEVAVACNFAHARQSVPLPDGRWEVALASSGQPGLVGAGIELPPDSVAVLTRRSD